MSEDNVTLINDLIAKASDRLSTALGRPNTSTVDLDRLSLVLDRLVHMLPNR